jgi:hypothetical protein
MYCDVQWVHSYQYKDHLKEHYPNVDPDAVLGEAPGSQRRDKIIARFHSSQERVSFRELSRQSRESESGDEARRDE